MNIVALTVAEIRRLLAGILRRTPHSLTFLLSWSYWRRRHQAEAKRAHYRARGVQLQL
jgi:hypothetical protein